MYYFIPKINFTNPLKNLGTFFTTIVIFPTLLYNNIVFPVSFNKNQHESHIIPIVISVTPITNNQPEKGSNITSNTPIPNPIKHTAKVFLKSLSINYLPKMFS